MQLPIILKTKGIIQGATITGLNSEIFCPSGYQKQNVYMGRGATLLSSFYTTVEKHHRNLDDVKWVYV